MAKTKIMFSGRFLGGAEEKYLRDTAAALNGRPGVEVLVVEADAGDRFGDQTIRYMNECDVVVAMVCKAYGEKTPSRYCTYREVRFFLENEKFVIPVQVYEGEWPPTPGEEGTHQNRVFFTQDLVKVMAIRDGELASPEEVAARIFNIVMKKVAKELVTAKKVEEGDALLSVQVDAASGARAENASYAMPFLGSPHLCRNKATLCLILMMVLAGIVVGVLGGLKLWHDYSEAATLKLLDAPGWFELGHYHGGGAVGGRIFTKVECYENALAIDPQMAMAWYNLGVVGGGKVAGNTYDQRGCYERSLSIDPKYAPAWNNMGYSCGGGTVAGKDYDKKQCFAQALSLDSEYSTAWANLARQGGGKVGSTTYTALECAEKGVLFARDEGATKWAQATLEMVRQGK